MLASCNKEVPEVSLEDGTYYGTFERKLVGSEGTVSNISLTFDSGLYGGQSDAYRYPAIGNGSYEISGDKIEFIDINIWTADFDWSLILVGEYSLSKDGETIEFSRVYSNEEADVYMDIFILHPAANFNPADGELHYNTRK